MSKLFETNKIKGMTLANRFVRSVTWEEMVNQDGSYSIRWYLSSYGCFKSLATNQSAEFSIRKKSLFDRCRTFRQQI